MYTGDPAHHSAKRRWDKSGATDRWQMMQEVGYSAHRTYTLRAFDDLPIEVKIDLNYAADLKHRAATTQPEAVPA